MIRKEWLHYWITGKNTLINLTSAESAETCAAGIRQLASHLPRGTQIPAIMVVRDLEGTGYDFSITFHFMEIKGHLEQLGEETTVLSAHTYISRAWLLPSCALGTIISLLFLLAGNVQPLLAMLIILPFTYLVVFQSARQTEQLLMDKLKQALHAT